VNKILRARNNHEKEYIVKVERPFDDSFLKKMSGGVPILDTVTRECHVERLSRDTFRIILTQGLNRQIRRMTEYLGYRVVSLKRIRIMNITLGSLETGKWRNLSPLELKGLEALLKDSEKTYTP
jgi:23S rRNA pseudouridine2604 synthase